METGTSDLVDVMAADLPRAQCVEPLQQESVMSDTHDTEMASTKASSESN